MVDQRYLRPGFDFALAHAIEEAGEFLAAAGKTQRWGRDSVNPDLPPEQQETNEAWMLREITDLRGSLDRLLSTLGSQAVEPEREVDIARLRAALIDMGRQIPGCALSDEVSTDFLMLLPEEMRAWQAKSATLPASPIRREADEWQDIATAPKDGTAILITRETQWPEELYHVVFWSDGGWEIHDGKNDHPLRGPNPTLWRPLPALASAPKASDGESGRG